MTKASKRKLNAKIHQLECLAVKTHKQAKQLLALKLRAARLIRCKKQDLKLSVDDYIKTGYSVTQ